MASRQLLLEVLGEPAHSHASCSNPKNHEGAVAYYKSLELMEPTREEEIVSEDTPQSLSNPQVLTEAEAKLRAELLEVQNDPRLSLAQRQAKMRELGGRVGPMGRADLYRRKDATG